MTKFTSLRLDLGVVPAHTYIGCYRDDAGRDLPDLEWVDVRMTKELCASHCSGYSYFALQVESYNILLECIKFNPYLNKFFTVTYITLTNKWYVHVYIQ